jgi:GNAT superfamily N-acetyltransferase
MVARESSFWSVFTAASFRAIELGEDDVPALQRFLEANPAYFLDTAGEGPAPDEALRELRDDPPPGMRFDRRWLLGFVDPGGELIAMANVSSDFLAPGVWLVGLFIVASSQHGTGAAATIYGALEAWARENGAQWMRLGVVVGNTRAERFWEKAGYTEARQRPGVTMGRRVNTLSVMYKPLDGGSLEDYLALVERDRPDAS